MTTRDEVVAKRIAEAGELYKPLMRKAYAGECSPRSAIKAFCLHCTGEDRQAIRTCSGYSCPLWRFRPYSEGGTE
jgi:hypothetical protein